MVKDGTDQVTSGSTDPAAEQLIDRLYDVAVDPGRYEALLDHWEAMMAPRRAVANDATAPVRVGRLEDHFERADQILDRVIARAGGGTGADMLAQIDRAAAFVVGADLTIAAVNPAASQVFGVTRGARLEDLALAEGEAVELANQVGRLLHSNTGAPAVLRIHGAHADRLILLHLRLVRREDEPSFVIAVSSELGWPAGFSDMLRSAFDLTPAEGEVMRALAEGLSLADIAAARGRSVETVRAQLRALMAKTETRSQSELVRLTLSTMEIAQFSDVAAQAVRPSSTGFGTLAPRPFHSLTLPDGRRLDYLILGDPAGAPCLFFPLDYGLVRWPASAEAEATRRGLKIVVAVRPGYGASTPLPRGVPYVAQLAADMARLLDHLGIARVPLVTMGGDSFIGIAFHATYPERVTALICCGGVLPLTRPEQYERMEKWHRFILAGARYTPHLLPFMVKAGFALARKLGKRGFIHAVYGNCPADVATFEIPEVFEAMVCGSEVSLSDTHSAHDAFSREVIAHETTDWSAEVAALRDSVPVHFLNGLQDPQIPPETLADHQRDYPWIDFRVYPDAGQLLFFLKWRDVIGLIQRHTASQPREAGPDRGPGPRFTPNEV